MRDFRPVGAAVATAVALAWGLPASAQTQAPVLQEQLPPAAAGKASPGTAVAGKSVTGGGASESSSESGLGRRVESLEEQLVDLQVVIGTLESLARSGGTAAAAQSNAFRAPTSASSPGDQARIESLEAQVRALTQQVEQLQAGGGPQRRTDATSQFSAPPAPGGTATARFGETTVTSDTGDPIGGLIGDPQQPAGPGAPSGGPSPGGWQAAPTPGANPGAVAALPEPPPSTATPKQAYETAYGYLLQQDYGAAQLGFTEFLKQYPTDSLVPNALYWLGETHYVQRNYADAAEAFDLVTQSYGSSAKAPDSQLKRGMSLAQLGKKSDACSVLSQIASRYPGAAPHVKAKADSERQRLGCS